MIYKGILREDEDKFLHQMARGKMQEYIFSFSEFFFGIPMLENNSLHIDLFKIR